MALRPKGRVHPFVEPTFGTTHQWDNETASQPAIEMVSSETAPRVQATSAGESLAHSTLRDRTAKDGAPQSQQQASREMYQPLMAEASGESAGSNPMLESVERGEPTVRSPTVRDTTAKDETSGPQRRGRRRDNEAEEMDLEFEPLMRGTAREASEAESSVHPTRNAEAVPNETSGLMHAAQDIKSRMGEAFGTSGLRSAAEMAAARRLAQQQRARVQAEQQSDEIQIHIGRIEVTAMPPAAPHSVPAPVRKTQTLDEYLRRSSGRAG
jgi:hypothetical protein